MSCCFATSLGTRNLPLTRKLTLKGQPHSTISNHFRGLVFPNSVQRTLSAEPALLDTTERRGRVGDQASIDANHANLEMLSNTVDAVQILREEVACESNKRVIGQLDHLVLGL